MLMSEKRFVYTRDNVDNFLTPVIDTKEEKLLSQGDVINLLNELAFENEALKLMCTDYILRIERLEKG